jgi:hypothetical protein
MTADSKSGSVRPSITVVVPSASSANVVSQSSGPSSITLYRVPAGPQAVDDVTVVKITTGQLIEPARDDKDELGHSSAAS